MAQGIGLALGGGGVRACTHIGFYRVLKENNIPISHISGTSMGAIIGAAIAMGMEPQKMRDFVLSLKSMNLLRWGNFNFFDESLVKSDDVTKVLNLLFGEATFDDLKIPFGCTAVDLESQKEFMITKGSIVKAVQASSAYPLIFSPVFYQEKYLIDGGVLDGVPVKLVREMGAEKIVAIRIRNNVARQYISGQIYMRYYKKSKVMGFFDRIKGFFKRKQDDLKLFLDIGLESVAIPSDKILERSLEESKPDILLNTLVEIPLLDFSKVDEAIKLGEKSATEALPEIRKLLNI